MDPYALAKIPYDFRLLRIGIGLGANVAALVGLAAVNKLESSGELILFAVVMTGIGLVGAHTDYLIRLAARETKKIAFYIRLYSAYRNTMTKAGELEARLLARHPTVAIDGTVIRDGRVHLILAAKSSSGEDVAAGQDFAVVQTIRREVWGRIRVIAVEDGRAIAQLTDYLPNAVFWGLLEANVEHDASVPEGLLAYSITAEGS